MDAPLTLLDLAGMVALLLWGVRMVQTGVQRAFGPRLRQILAIALGGRIKAFVAGVGATAILQSSTATGLMLTGFAASGLVDLVPALAVMLGANVGTTLIVQLLSFDVSDAAPALILLGVMLFRRGEQTRTRDLGRVAIGLGLMLIALTQILALIAPYEDQPDLQTMLGAIATSPVLDVLIAAGLTWAAHSSVTIVLLAMSFAAQHVVPPEAGFALVLGANLGTAINPVLEGGAGEASEARRVPVGNLLNRVAGVALALAFLPRLGTALMAIEPDASRAVADFHTLFNLAIAALFFPVLGPYARLLRRLLPARAATADAGKPLYLSESAREAPGVALGGAAREALRLADVLEAMLMRLKDLLHSTDRKRVGEAKRLDDVLDRLNTAIRAYLARLDPEAMTEADHQRLSEILTFATNMEQAGDVVDRCLLERAGKKMRLGLTFTAEVQADLLAHVDRLVENLHRAAGLFMNADERAARRLAAEKEVFREIEARATETHFRAMQGTSVIAAETSSLHLDILRDLKQVNAHLVAAGAYAVLASAGELLPSRLRPMGGAAPRPADEDD